MINNLIKGELPTDQQTALLQAINDIQSKLPFLLDLTTADRRSLPKLGDKSRTFIDHGLILATQNTGILPRNFDLDQYSQKVMLVRQLEPVILAMRQLMKRMEDTFMAIGSDAYSQTLVVYRAAKLANKNGLLDEHLDSLAQRFARKSLGQDTPPDTPA
jgi:hypothetical protein